MLHAKGVKLYLHLLLSIIVQACKCTNTTSAVPSVPSTWLNLPADSSTPIHPLVSLLKQLLSYEFFLQYVDVFSKAPDASTSRQDVRDDTQVKSHEAAVNLQLPTKRQAKYERKCCC